MADDEDHEEELVDIDITEWKKFKVQEGEEVWLLYLPGGGAQTENG